jgi:hypothetical protein
MTTIRVEDGAMAEDPPNTKQAADVVSDKRPGRVGRLAANFSTPPGEPIGRDAIGDGVLQLSERPAGPTACRRARTAPTRGPRTGLCQLSNRSASVENGN